MTTSVRDESTVGDPLFAGPTHVDLDLTNACNLACSHCHAASGKPLPDELTTAELVGLIADLHLNGVLSLTVAGGEPFMRPDILTLLSYACGLPGWEVTVISNGTYLTPELCDKLAADCPGLAVNVSIDGSTPTRFGVYRHQLRRTLPALERLFDSVVAGARNAQAAGLRLGINFTLTRANADDLDEVYRLAADDIGARSVQAIKFFTAGRGLDAVTEMAFPYDVWSTLFSDLTRRKITGDYPKLSMSIAGAWEFYLPLIDSGIDLEAAEHAWNYRGALRESFYAQRRSLGDGSGVADLNIAGNGDVYPTVLMAGHPGAVAGNIRRRDFRELWWDSTRLTMLRDLELSDIGSTCTRCSAASLCGGGSRARGLLSTDHLDGEDLACPRVHAAAVEASTADRMGPRA